MLTRIIILLLFEVKLINLFRHRQAHSNENYFKQPGPRHTYYHILVIKVTGKKMHEGEIKYTEE